MDVFPILPPGAAPTGPGIAAAILALPHEARTAAVLRHCIELGGTLLRPGQGTHLFEITLLGLHARGEDLAGAARNWLAAGANQIAGAAPKAAEPEADPDLLELARATAIIARAADWPDDKLRAACASIVRLSHDWLLIERAAMLKRQLDREAAERGRA